MSRTKTLIATLAAFFVAAVHAPAFGQKIYIDGPDGHDVVIDANGRVEKHVDKDVKGKPSKRSSKKAEAEKPKIPQVPTFTATGGFEATKEKARESAVRVAVEKLHEYMSQQRPSIHRAPTTEMIQRMLLSEQEKITEEPIISETGKTETMYRITVAVHVDEAHVRELRSRERSSEALWVLAGLGGLAGVLAVFFRIDSWTKGYLTSWLVLGTVGAGALLSGIWWMAK